MPKDEDVIMRGVEERYEKEDGVVYKHWRFVGTKKWNKKITLYKEIPYVKTEKTYKATEGEAGDHSRLV